MLGRSQRPRVWPRSDWADQEGTGSSGGRPPRPQASRRVPAEGRAQGSWACTLGAWPGAVLA